MDAVEFVRGCKRMCASADTSDLRDYNNADTPEEMVAAVEKWLRNHPYSSNLDKLREIFPRLVYSGDAIDLCPCKIDNRRYCDNPGKVYEKCRICQARFWNSKYTEGKK